MMSWLSEYSACNFLLNIVEVKGRKIHQFFEEQQELNSILGFPISDLPYNLCWYPSAGLDFRHIVHFELSHDLIKNKPSVYLLTDANISLYSQDGNFPLAAGSLLHQSDATGVSLFVKDCFQVNLKQALGFHPYSRDAFNNGLLHENFNDHHSGNVFFILGELHAVLNFRKIKIEVPMFYFTYENMDFLMNFLLPNEIRINTLIHIKDGSNYGGSSYPMDFIYQFQRELKLKRIITDRNLISDFVNYELIEGGILEYYNFQQEWNFFNRNNGTVSQRVFETFNLNRNPYRGWKSERMSLPANDMSHYDNNQDLLFSYIKET